jgi:hypothetical protein
MGGASNAVFWGEEQDHWANPALLGQARGIRFETSRSRVAAFLADPVPIESTDLVMGMGGLGLVFSGRPNGLGRVLLDYGLHSDYQSGSGSVETNQSVSSWGFGVNIIESVENIKSVLNESALGRIAFDVSFGMKFKQITIRPSLETTAARDWGLLFRGTPIDRLDTKHGFPIRVDIAYGFSSLNYNDDATFGSVDGPNHITEHWRNGGALRLAFDTQGLVAACAENTKCSRWVQGIRPLVSIGLSGDKDDLSYRGPDKRSQGWGAEMTIARVFSIRRGHSIDHDYWPIDGPTWGWSVGVPVGRWAGIMFEEARFPQPRQPGQSPLPRRAVIAWFDPTSLVRRSSGSKPRRYEAPWSGQ